LVYIPCFARWIELTLLIIFVGKPTGPAELRVHTPMLKGCLLVVLRRNDRAYAFYHFRWQANGAG